MKILKKRTTTPDLDRMVETPFGSVGVRINEGETRINIPQVSRGAFELAARKARKPLEEFVRDCVSNACSDEVYAILKKTPAGDLEAERAKIADQHNKWFATHGKGADAQEDAGARREAALALAALPSLGSLIDETKFIAAVSDMDGADEPELTDIEPDNQRRWDQLTSDYVKWTKDTSQPTVAQLAAIWAPGITDAEIEAAQKMISDFRGKIVAAEDKNSDSEVSKRASDFVADVIAGRVTRPDRHKAAEALGKAEKGDKVTDAIGRGTKGWAPFGLITKTDQN